MNCINGTGLNTYPASGALRGIDSGFAINHGNCSGRTGFDTNRTSCTFLLIDLKHVTSSFDSTGWITMIISYLLNMKPPPGAHPVARRRLENALRDDYILPDASKAAFTIGYMVGAAVTKGWVAICRVSSSM